MLLVTFAKFNGLPMSEKDAINDGWTKTKSCNGKEWIFPSLFLTAVLAQLRLSEWGDVGLYGSPYTAIYWCTQPTTDTQV